MNEKAENGFDERACEALGYLLGQFWILREKEPEKYQLVRDRERVLRGYLLDKLGLNLIVHRHFAKLEKVPVVPQVWMGIQEFSQPRDYALFCLLLAYLEGKTVEEQFLLSDLCEELQSTYPGEEGLNWTHYEHRKSLVRVLLKATDLGILKVVDGDIEGFGFNEGQEVLYEVPVVSRYFMRSYPKDIFKYHDREEILKAEWDRGYDEALQRRHRVYRQLFLTPAIHSRGAEDPDFRSCVIFATASGKISKGIPTSSSSSTAPLPYLQSRNEEQCSPCFPITRGFRIWYYNLLPWCGRNRGRRISPSSMTVP